MNNKNIYCPICGKTDKVKNINTYFEKWICERCNVLFSFSKFNARPFPNNSIEKPTQPLDPAKIDFAKVNVRLVDPKRRIFIEKHDSKIKLSSNINSFYELLGSKELLKSLPKLLGDENGTQSGEIDLENGTINPIEY